MKTLTTPPPAEQATDFGFCSDCGSPLTLEDVLCELERCEFAEIEDLMYVAFFDEEFFFSTQVWVSRTADLEVVVDVAVMQFEERGIDVSEMELLHIHHMAEDTPGIGIKFFDKPEVLA
jgi:hypothetical protein